MMDKMKTGFFKALRLLGDYLPEIVIGGGCAPIQNRFILFMDDCITSGTIQLTRWDCEVIFAQEKYVDSLIWLSPGG